MPVTAALPAADRRGGFPDVLRSEFVKLRSVRSTYWTLLAAVVSNIAFAVAAAAVIPGALSAADKQTVDPIRLSLAGLHLSQVAVGVLGVLVISGEYGSGMIRATFAAVPRRRAVLAAKALTFAAAAAGGGIYLAVLGLLGLGLGAVVRRTAGAVAVLLGLLFVPAILLELLPAAWRTTVGPYLPMQAGSQIFIARNRGPDDLGAWTGMGVFALYAVVAVVAALVLVERRDA